MRNTLRRSLCIIILLISFISSKAQESHSLTFNQKGELITDLPANIERIDSFIIRVPVKTFEDDKKLLDKARKNIYAQMNDTNSFFYGIVNEWPNSLNRDSLIRLYNSNPERYVFSYLDTQLNNNGNYDTLQIFPQGFIDYDSLMRFINGPDGNIHFKNSNLVPYSVTIGENKEALKCDAISKKGNTIEFIFLNTKVPEKDGSISYALLKTDILHQLALNHFNSIYEVKDSSIRLLTMLDSYFSKEVSKLSKTIDEVVDSIALIQEFPEGTSVRSEKEEPLWQQYRQIRLQLFDKIGNIDGNRTVFAHSILLKKWILQWAWLTGGTGVLNPFKFTSANNIRPASVAGDSLKLKDAFYSRMLDSLKSFDDINKMEELVKHKQRIVTNNSTIAGAKANAVANQNEITKFSTTAVTLNTGTIFCDEKTSIRNYYFNKDVRADKNGFKFKYPEDSTVVLLYHNVPAGTHIEIQGNYKSFDDTPDFTKFVGKAIDTLGGLFSLVNGALGGFKKLESLTTKKTLNAHDAPVVTASDLTTTIIPVFYTSQTNKPVYGDLFIKPEGFVLESWGFEPGRNRLDNGKLLNIYKSSKKNAQKISNSLANGSITSDKGEKLKIRFVPNKSEKMNALNQKFIAAFNNDTIALKRFDSIINKIGNHDKMQLQEYVKKLTLAFKIVIPTVFIKNPVEITSKQRSMYKALHLLCSSIQLPSPERLTLEEITDTNSRFKTQAFLPDTKEAPYKFEYSFTKIVRSDTAKAGYLKYKTDSSYFNVGKRYRFQLAAGLAYSFAPIISTNIDTSNHSFAVNKDENRMRIIAGVRFYLGKQGLYQHNNRVFPKANDKNEWLNKTSIMVGVGIPRPLDNYYIGAGYDIVPGLNINFGGHFYRYTNYQVANNTIVDNSSILKLNGYMAVTIDPTLFVKILKTL